MRTKTFLALATVMTLALPAVDFANPAQPETSAPAHGITMEQGVTKEKQAMEHKAKKNAEHEKHRAEKKAKKAHDKAMNKIEKTKGESETKAAE